MLRYAGGKSRAIKTLSKFIPNETKEVVSPFLGGGSFELHLSKTIDVYASDCFEPLGVFWKCMKEHRAELVARLRELHPFTKERYYECKATLHEGSVLDRAVKFFIINRCCFSGCITGGYTPSRSPISCIDALERVSLDRLTIAGCDYEEQLAKYPSTFAYLDPPYDVPNLYGSTDLEHERFARVLRERKSNWILCYNDTTRIRALYQEWCEIHSVQWAYGMNASRKSNEIIIVPKAYQ